MNQSPPDAVQRPAAAGVLMFFGVASVIGGTLAFIGACAESDFRQLSMALSALVGGFVLIGFSAGLSLLTKIANYLAHLASKDDPPKPSAVKEIVKEAAALKSPPPEPGVYKI